MTKKECLELIIAQAGNCFGINCRQDECPLGTDGECKYRNNKPMRSDKLIEAKRLLDKEANKWTLLDICNMPYDIGNIREDGKSVYEWQWDNKDGEWCDCGWRPDAILFKRRDVNFDTKFRYRKRQQEQTCLGITAETAMALTDLMRQHVLGEKQLLEVAEAAANLGDYGINNCGERLNDIFENLKSDSQIIGCAGEKLKRGDMVYQDKFGKFYKVKPEPTVEGKTVYELATDYFMDSGKGNITDAYIAGYKAKESE